MRKSVYPGRFESLINAIKGGYFWELEIKQFIKWGIVYNPIWKITVKDYYVFVWDVPTILHIWIYNQPEDDGIDFCIFHSKIL